MAKQSGTSGIFHKVPQGTNTNANRGGSAAQNTAVGSGSRPTKSVHPIESSAPEDAYGLGRATGNALK